MLFRSLIPGMVACCSHLACVLTLLARLGLPDAAMSLCSCCPSGVPWLCPCAGGTLGLVQCLPLCCRAEANPNAVVWCGVLCCAVHTEVLSCEGPATDKQA